MKVISLLFFFIIVVVSRASAQDSKPSLGVMEATLVGQGFDPELRPVFTSLVRGKVVDLVHDSVDVMEGAKLEKLVATNAASCSNAECLVQFTRSIGVDYLLETRLLYRKGNWTATIKLASAASASLLAEKTEIYANEAAVQAGLPRLAAQAVASLVKGGGSSEASGSGEQDVPLAPPPAGAKKVIVAFASSPSGAVVTVDGKGQGVTPCRKTLLQGEHLVEMVHDNYRSERRKVTLETNGQEVSFPLEPLQTRLSLETVDAQSNDAILSDVYVDGTKVGQTPFDGLVPMNARKIEVAAEGYQRTAVAVTLEEGKMPSATVKLDNSGMVKIPAGCFLMGSPKNEKDHNDDERQHKVCVSGFRMDRILVTQGAYQKVMGKNPSHFGKCGDDCPVEQVDWNEASAYCHKMGKRLPTEAEWEYAARAGSTTAFYWGNDTGVTGRYAWYDGNSGGMTHPVAQKKPNKWGLYDMAGNVWEWTADWYGETYPAKAQKNPKGPASGSRRVFRGGSWSFNPAGRRSAHRGSFTPDGRLSLLGFRCVSP